MIDLNAGPPNLETLAKKTIYDPPIPSLSGQPVSQYGPWLPEIPKSSFDQVPPRWIFIAGLGGGLRYLAWTPGPDREFNLEADEDIRDKLFSVKDARDEKSPYINAVYDTSNGARSGGDILRGGDLWFAKEKPE